MKASIARRLADLERRRENRSRQMHIIKASDIATARQQISRMVADGTVNQNDGLLCITKR